LTLFLPGRVSYTFSPRSLLLLLRTLSFHLLASLLLNRLSFLLTRSSLLLLRLLRRTLSFHLLASLLLNRLSLLPCSPLLLLRLLRRTLSFHLLASLLSLLFEPSSLLLCRLPSRFDFISPELLFELLSLTMRFSVTTRRFGLKLRDSLLARFVYARC